jgi:hypothetical protein
MRALIIGFECCEDEEGLVAILEIGMGENTKGGVYLQGINRDSFA